MFQSLVPEDPPSHIDLLKRNTGLGLEVEEDNRLYGKLLRFKEHSL